MANHQIYITENGTTTLATVGKYCDRNIDVITNVPSYESELAKQKAITDGLLADSITTYFNDTVTRLRSNAFSSCTVLERVEFTQHLTIMNLAFRYCESLTRVILRSESVCELRAIATFNGTPIADGAGYIYVPDNLVDTYKTATNWATFADQIKPISELEE